MRLLIKAALAAVGACCVTAVSASPMDWTLMNSSSFIVNHVYIAPTRGGGNEEGADLLAAHPPLGHGDLIAVPISTIGGCREYDLLVEFKVPVGTIPPLHLEGIDVCDLRNQLFVLKDDNG